MVYHIVCVGAGGTGGNFLKELGRFLLYFHEENVEWRLSIVDGDTIEAKNGERQPFCAEDVMQHKSSVIAEGLVDYIGLPQGWVRAYTRYIDTYEQMREIIGSSGKGENMVILIGGVDNHRARQVMHEIFYGDDVRNIVYIDSANEFEEGEVCCGIRLAGKEIAPPRAYYFPEILTDKGKRASELSCGVINESAPQHLITNLCAAQHLLTFVVNIMKNHKLEGGVVHFNAFTHYCRFDRWTSEMQSEKNTLEAVGEEAEQEQIDGEKVMTDGEE